MPPRNTPRPYSPPLYLLTSTGLSHDEFVAQYEGFRNSLQLVEAAPELVFERLVGNLAQALNGALAQDRIERITLHSAPNYSTTDGSTGQRRTDPYRSRNVEHSACEVPHSPVVLPGVTTSESTAREIYLQFWFPTSSIEPESGKVFSISQACTTTTPVPYGLASSSANAYTLRGSKFSGTYDSRIDSSITSPTIPVIISKVIAFNPPFTDTPEVVVWLTGLSATTGAVVSILVTATNITTTQFTLQIDSSAGDHLFSVGAAWAVWKADVKLGVDFRNTFQRSVSHSVWTLQHAAVSAVKLVLEPEQYMTLDATMVEYRDDTKIWHYRLMLGDWKEHSVTMVTVMRSS